VRERGEREYQGLEVVVDGVEAGVWVVRLRRVGCDPDGPGEKGETRVGHKRIHHIKAPGFGYHFRFQVVTRLWSYGEEDISECWMGGKTKQRSCISKFF
jgi:hypothetical protein